MYHRSTSELFHFGTKGMRWGVRRYQNADGTLTAAGKKRYDRDARENGWEMGEDGKYRSTGKKSKVQNANADKWVKDDLNRTKRLSDESANMTRNLENANKTIGKIQNANTPRMDLSNMTDKEMRDQINRAMLERQYDDMFNPKKQSSGRDYVNNTLEVVGSTLAITSSALGIALAIKELKG